MDTETSKRRKTGGRQKGTPNRLTRCAREAFEYAFQRRGGAEGLARWANAHPDDFYKLYARLIPAEGLQLAPPMQVIINSPRIAAALARSPPTAVVQAFPSADPDSDPDDE